MKHPFDGILEESPSRRQYLKSALVLGVAAMASSADSPPMKMTKAGPGHPEHGGKLAPTRAAPSHPEHGGRFDRRPTATAAGKGLEDGKGQTKLSAVDAELDRIEGLVAKKNWSEASVGIAPLRRLKTGSRNSRAAAQSARREELDKQVTKLAKSALSKADKQAESGDLTSALRTYRQASRLDDAHGLKQRSKKGLAGLAKQPGYANALTTVKTLEAGKPRMQPRPKRPPITTLALGEEG